MQVFGLIDNEAVKIGGAVFTAFAANWVKDALVERKRKRLLEEDRKLREFSQDSVTKILGQLTPNGGASLADKITRIDKSLTDLHQTIDTVREALGKRLDVLESNFSNAGKVLAAKKRAARK